MAFWSRFKESQIRVLSNGLKRFHLQTHNHGQLQHGGTLTHAICLTNSPSLTNRANRGEILNSARFFAAPVQAHQKEEKDKDGCRLNEKITAPFVRLVTDEGHTVVSRFEALDRAKHCNLDLVEVDRAADPPVCKIMDYHKETYVKHVKDKEKAKKKSDLTLKKGGCKEVRFHCKTEQKDLKTKADTIKRMMDKGYRVKCMAVGSGSENEKLGEVLAHFSSLIEDVGLIESGPHVEKKQAYIVIRHAKFGPLKKGSQKKTAASKVGLTLSAIDDDQECGVEDTEAVGDEDGSITEDLTDEDVEDTFDRRAFDEGRTVINQPVERENNRYRRESPPPPLPVTASSSPAAERENRYKRESPPPPVTASLSPAAERENRYRREPPPPPVTASSSPAVENRYRREPPPPPPPPVTASSSPAVENRYQRETTPPPVTASSSPAVENRYRRETTLPPPPPSWRAAPSVAGENRTNYNRREPPPLPPPPPQFKMNPSLHPPPRSSSDSNFLNTNNRSSPSGGTHSRSPPSDYSTFNIPKAENAPAEGNVAGVYNRYKKENRGSSARYSTDP
ncbi:unnamed protein product [Cuscuta epithymum]|uniref:Translation initiation factor 3 N-terminal domain-containing protein n=2 Tax=Cuscuta epithymum TaxID=186058 RepID=A0AAV0E877_9ASTE|nr:unnamed protein product [Cuscuta epithymum]